MLDQSDACLLVLDEQYLDRVEAIQDRIPKVKKIVIYGSPPSVPKLNQKCISWSELTENSGDFKREEVLWSDPYCILYTSGTQALRKLRMPQNYVRHMGALYAMQPNILKSIVTTSRYLFFR
jgi:crotonobetaine/carnitine-CoA ligase